MTARREQRKESRPRGEGRARSSRQDASRKSTQRITPRGAAGAAGRQRKITEEEAQERPAREPARAEIVRPRAEPGDDLLRDLLLDVLGPSPVARRFAPDLDVRETPEALIVEAELPGLTEDDVHVTVQGDVLTIEGHKRWREVRDDELLHVLERGEGRFLRSFRLPAPAAEGAVEATFDDGLLTVTVRKPTREEARRIEVRPTES